MTGTSQTPRILFPFITITLIWGSTWIVILGQLGTVPPSWSVTYRFIVATLCMAAYVLATGAPVRIGTRGHGMAVLFGLLQFCLNFNFVYLAELHLTSGLVAVSFSSLIVTNAVLSRIFLKVPITGRFMVGSAIGMSGIALLFFNEFRLMSEGDGSVVMGLGLTLIAILSASAANVMQASERARALPMLALITWGMFYGTVADGLWALIASGPPVIEATWGYLAGILDVRP